jgi:superfamily II DNA helicase RecQ
MKTLFLFSSPQLIVTKPAVLQILQSLLQNGHLVFVAVNELHLFVHFALSFRTSFASLKPILFDHLHAPSSTAPLVPLLLMTVTCTPRILKDAEELLGFTLEPSNIHWPSPAGMRHRSVDFQLLYTSKAYTLFKTLLSALLRQPTRKYIVYVNQRLMVQSFSKNYSLALDEDDSLYEVDIVCLVGTLTKEQKAHHIIRTFVQGSYDSFNPRLLVATSGAANAGLDDPNVCGVFLLDFPALIIDWAQEKGRAGRYDRRRLLLPCCDFPGILFVSLPTMSRSICLYRISSGPAR